MSEHIERVIEVVLEIEQGGESLPEDDRRSYVEAKNSIVEARRSAETQEKPLQFCW